MNNTIIVLLSDHGYHLGELDLWCKSTNFESDTRIPLIISAPNIKNKGVHTDGIVESVDLYPTLANLAGLPIPNELDGFSMVPLMKAPERPWKKAAFSQFPRPWMYKNQPEVMGYSVRTKDFRYTEWRSFQDGQVQSKELYHYPKGCRLEDKNIAGSAKYRAIQSQLKQLLDAGWQRALPMKE